MTRYSPCGSIVDIARRPYKTACRFLRDDDRVSTIRWAEAQPDARPLPYPSVILSLDFERSDSQEWPVGEVDGAPRPFIHDAVPPGLIGDHVCGTEDDFEQGGQYRPDLPPAEYDADGWLRCCTGPKKVHGGAGAGGHAVAVVTLPLTRPGGAGAGGHVVPTYSEWIDPTEGGVEIGGEVPEVWSPPTPAEGGVEIGGSAGDVYDLPPPTPGSACTSAAEVYLGTTYSYTSPSNTTDQQWFHFTVPPGDYHFDTFGFNFAVTPVADGLAQDGVICGSLVPRSLFSADCNGLTILFAGGIWLRVTSQFGFVSVPYTFKLSTGLCPP